MREGDGEKSWLIWLLVVPVCMTLGALLARWVFPPAGTAPAAGTETRAAAAPGTGTQPPEPAAPDNSKFELPGDEPASDASVSWANKPAAATQPAAAKPEPAAAAGDPKKDNALGFKYGAISKAVEKLLNSPKAVAAILNNGYVVKGFMSRDTVRKATASSASLANYLKNPANLNNFMAKPAVQGGLNDPALVNAAASSKLVGALLDTPGGHALLNDPVSLAGVIQANPGLIDVLKNPNILNALLQNPKTAGVVGQLGMGGPQ